MVRAKRKLDHIEYALSTGQSRTHSFHDIDFVHQSLPNSNYDTITCETKSANFTKFADFYQYDDWWWRRKTLHINEQLAYVAKQHNLAMAVGSQMAALKDESEAASYKVIRKVNPNGIFFC